jgi:hypothetical protein
MKTKKIETVKTRASAWAHGSRFWRNRPSGAGIVRSLMTLCMVLMLTPMFTLAVSAAGRTVTITEGQTVAEIQTAIQTAIDEINTSETVTVTGKQINPNTMLIIDIPANKRVLWQAEYVGHLNNNQFTQVLLTGEGTFEIPKGGSIHNTGNARTLGSEGPAILVSGGSVTGSTGVAVFIYPNGGNLTVNEGFVGAASNISTISSQSSSAVITVNGGWVQGGTNGAAIANNSGGSVVITNGLVQGRGHSIGTAISSGGHGGSITISGGTVTSDYERTIRIYDGVDLMITGGVVRRGSVGEAICAMNSITGSITVGGGVVFAHGDDANNVINTSLVFTPPAIYAPGAVIAWGGTGDTFNARDTVQDITSNPAGVTASWAVNNGRSGMNYTYGSGILGFIEVAGVTVIRTPIEIIWDGGNWNDAFGSGQPDIQDGDILILKTTTYSLMDPRSHFGAVRIPEGAHITVRGTAEFISQSGYAGFVIPETSTVTWEADVIGHVFIQGKGRMNMPSGSITVDNQQMPVALAGGATIDISGGTVSNDRIADGYITQAIHIYGDPHANYGGGVGGHVIVRDGGLVSTNRGIAITMGKENWAADNGIISVTVEDGGTVITHCTNERGSWAIYTGDRGGTITINGGTVSSAGHTAIRTDQGNLTITGGTISATGLKAGYTFDWSSGTIFDGRGSEIIISGGTIEATHPDGFALDTYQHEFLTNTTITGGTLNGWVGGLAEITDISVSPEVLCWDGGEVVVTITGTYLTNGITVVAYPNGIVTWTAPTGTTTGTNTTQTVTLTLPENVISLNDIHYIFKAAIVPSWFLDEHTARVDLTDSILPPPVLSAGSFNRTSDWGGTVDYTTDKTGRGYYLMLDIGAPAPTKETVRANGYDLGHAQKGRVTGAFVAVTVIGGEKDIYIIVEDSAGYLSEPLKISTFIVPPTGIPGIKGYLWAMIMFLAISAGLWGYLLRRRLKGGNG